MDFASRLRHLRELRGLSRGELAERLGVTYSTVAKYEEGERRPDHLKLGRLAAILLVSTDYLLGLSDDPAPPSTHGTDQTSAETNAAHRDDDPISDLPEAARKSVDDFISYIRQKYSKKGN